MNGFAISNENGTHLVPLPKDLFKHFKAEYGYELEDYLPEDVYERQMLNTAECG